MYTSAALFNTTAVPHHAVASFKQQISCESEGPILADSTTTDVEALWELQAGELQCRGDARPDQNEPKQEAGRLPRRGTHLLRIVVGG